MKFRDNFEFDQVLCIKQDKKNESRINEERRYVSKYYQTYEVSEKVSISFYMQKKIINIILIFGYPSRQLVFLR